MFAGTLPPDGKDPFGDWKDKLRDLKARKAIDTRLLRLSLGNFGDHKSCGQGVFELRIDVGAGYRVYFAREGVEVILLLCAGDRSSQSADISRAVSYWKDWRSRA